MPVVDQHARDLSLVEQHACGWPLVEQHAHGFPLVDQHVHGWPLVEQHVCGAGIPACLILALTLVSMFVSALLWKQYLLMALPQTVLLLTKGYFFLSQILEIIQKNNCCKHFHISGRFFSSECGVADPMELQA